MKTLNEKLSSIQRGLNAPKNLYNTFGKYKYRSCESILEAVKPLLEGVTLTLSDRIIEIGGRFYIEATALLSDGESDIVVTASAREAETKKGMDVAQITGASSSYARKYALNGLFLIDDTKDADDLNQHGEMATPEPDNNNVIIRKLLAKYKGKDKDDIAQACTDAVRNKTFTDEFASKIIEQLGGE